jgi:hypothetical protein
MRFLRRLAALLPLFLTLLLTAPLAAVEWEDPSPDAEAREAFPARRPAALAAPSVPSESTPSESPWTPLPRRPEAGPAASPLPRACVRLLTGRLNL